MTVDAMQLLADFRSEVPLPGDDVARAVYGRVTGSSKRRPRGRRRLIVAVAFAVLVFSAAAVAAVREAPWWQSGVPPVDPQAVVSIAADNMPANVRVDQARTVVTNGDAALVAVPLDDTGYCLIPALDGRASFDAPCVYQVTHPERGDSDLTETGARAGSGAQWVVFGRITDPRAAKLDLGAFTVGLSTGGFFLAEIPEAQWAKLSGTANRGAILDSSGNTLRRGCVNWGTSPDGGAQRFSSTLWLDQAGGECKPQKLLPIPTIDVAHATKLFDVTLTMPFSIWKPGQQVTFEKAPASDGSTCVVLVGPGLPTSEQRCSIRLDQLPRAGASPIDVGFETQLAHADGRAFYSWQITGTTDPSAGIAKLTLSSPSSAAALTYGGGFFFAELPATTPGPRTGNVPLPDGPWTLTGYDAAGHEVTHVDLNELLARNSPH